MSVAIKFENISKQYRLGLVSTRTLSHDLNRWWKMNILGKEDPYLKIGEVNDRAHKGESEYVWALKDIDFEVEQGDVLGIIGKNGAGKSTLLKILSKVTAPTTGTIKARGRIASLLEVGTGFHPEMTGRENIYMNGSIMGMRKSEIARKLDEIVDFAGVERYLDTPVKRYSSGMMVRLGFAVAAHLDPEILVVDEVLAVGDAEFQKKAIGKMQDVSRGEGRTVLFVSHNMEAVKRLCNTGVLLKEGRIDRIGNVCEIIDLYQRNIIGNVQYSINERIDRKGSGYLIVSECKVRNNLGEIVNRVVSGTEVSFELTLKRQNKFFTAKNLIVTINITDVFGTRITHLSTFYHAKSLNITKDTTKICFIVPKIPLTSGQYYLGFYVSQGNDILDFLDYGVEMIVENGDYFKSGKITNTALFHIDHTWKEFSENG